MAKARVLEITLSVIGAWADRYPDPDMLQIANTATIADTASTVGVSANDMSMDLASSAIADNASGDSLVISVRIRGAKRYARSRL